MPKKIYLLLLYSAIMLSACKKRNQEPDYTIKATIIDGTTNARYANKGFTFEITGDPTLSGGRENVRLGSASTNDSGTIVFSYAHQQPSGFRNPRLMMTSQGLRFNDLPLNWSIDTVFYRSTMGSIKVNLKTENPLQQDDTLYFSYGEFINGTTDYQVYIDTITTTINGLYKTLRISPPNTGFFWGRGHEELKYDKDRNGFTYVENKLLDVKITGDPIINEVTINY